MITVVVMLCFSVWRSWAWVSDMVLVIDDKGGGHVVF